MKETSATSEPAENPSVPAADPAEEGRGGWRKDVLLPLGLSVLLTAVFFWDVAFTDRIFADRDTLLSYMPSFKFWADRILSGEFPQWFPYDGLGLPFVGAMHGMVFHPIKLLFLTMDVGTAMKWATLLCFPLAFNGMFRLCRALRLSFCAGLVGGLLFAFNGYMVSLTNNIPYLLGMASFPWGWWLTVRVYRSPSFARIALAAFSYALMLFVGEPQTFVTACIAGLAFAFVLDGWEGRRKKAFGLYCAVMALACLMCAVQWVPVLDVMSQGSPGGTDKLHETVYWSMHPFRFFDLLFDGMNGHSYLAGRWFYQKFYRYELANFWTRSIYFGFAGLVLCAFSWWSGRRKAVVVLGAVTVFALLLCMGRYVGLYEAVKVIPLFRPFRYPEKCLNVVMSCLSLLAAFGFGALESGTVSRKVRRIVIGASSSALVLFLVAESAFGAFSKVLVGALSPDPAPVPAPLAEEVNALFSMSLSMTLVLLLAIGWLAGRGNARALACVALAGTFGLLMSASGHVYSPALPELASEPIPPVRIMREETSEGDSPRYVALSSKTTNDRLVERGEFSEIQRASLMFMLSPNYGALFGIESGGMTLPAASRRLTEVANIQKNGSQFLFTAGLFSARHFIAWGGDYAALGGTEESIAYEHPDFGSLLVRMSGAMPRAYLTRPFCDDDFSHFESAILSGSAFFGDFAFIEGCGERAAEIQGKTPPAGVDLGSASIAFRHPEHVAVDVDALVDGAVLVLTDAYYSGWKATIDGAPAEILPANHAVRGVMVPKGRHRVEFSYRTPGLVPAAFVSVGTMILSMCAGLFLWARRKKMHPESDSPDGVGKKPVEAA